MAKQNGPKDATPDVLQLPPSHTNGSPKEGIPDQTLAPLGMVALRTEHGYAYVDVSQKLVFGPCVVQRSNGQFTSPPEHMMGKTTIQTEVGALAVNHDPATVAGIIGDERELIAARGHNERLTK